MRYIPHAFILLFSVFSVDCFSQDGFSICHGPLISYKYEPILVSSSKNGTFLARFEYDEEINSSVASIFKWDQKSYSPHAEFVLNQSSPHRLIISDLGSLILLGKKDVGSSNIDEISIYSKDRGLVNKIESTGRDYSDAPGNCESLKPWICRGAPIELDGQHLILFDDDGREIDIDLDSGQFKFTKSEPSRDCDKLY